VPEGSAHGHGEVRVRAGARVRAVLALCLLPAVVLTVIGLVALWPSAQDRVERVPTAAAGASFVRADVVRVLPDSGLLEVDVAGSAAPGPQMAYAPPEVFASGVAAGDPVRLLSIEGSGATVDFVWVDHVRDVPIALLAVAYAVLVVLVARWKGFAAMAGLVLSFAVIAGFTLPALLAGKPALPVALVTASLALFVTLYLAHGLNARTTTALLGTLLGLALTATLASWATGAAFLTGLSGEEGMVLQDIAGTLDLRGVVLCGIVLAGLGVLNDVTITQASAVWELRALAPHLSAVELFRRGMRIGRDHIASTVYTIAFAYVGAALPLMLLISLYDQPLGQTLTAGEIAEEVVRTLVGSIGLVAAIPLTTAIAALVVTAGAVRVGRRADDGVAGPGPGVPGAPGVVPVPAEPAGLEVATGLTREATPRLDEDL
jgi:uncharacterized membrane protein